MVEDQEVQHEETNEQEERPQGGGGKKRRSDRPQGERGREESDSDGEEVGEGGGTFQKADAAIISQRK